MPANPRGLIFCPELIPGVMSGAITVTSRVMKPQPICDDRAWAWYPTQGPPYGPVPWRLDEPCPLAEDQRCPFRVGEKRYVKEAWYSWAYSDTLAGYVADEDIPHGQPYRIRNPMFMRREQARAWVEILSVRPARCQDITREEILASGIVMDPSGAWCQGVRPNCYETSRDAYAALWERLNGGKRGFPWSGNWWTWRLTLKLTTKWPSTKGAPC